MVRRRPAATQARDPRVFFINSVHPTFYNRLYLICCASAQGVVLALSDAV
jgi:hypothetical protein